MCACAATACSPLPPRLQWTSIGGMGALLRARAGVGGGPGGPCDMPWTVKEAPKEAVSAARAPSSAVRAVAAC